MDTQRLLVLRKVTRTVAEHLRGQLKEHISALAPIIRPKLVFGDFVSGATRETPNFADKAFQEVVAYYQSFAIGKPFQAIGELKPPMNIVSSPVEIASLEYVYEARTDTDAKRVMITSPLKWVLSYPETGLPRLRELLAQRNPATDVAQRYCLHYAVLAYVLRRQPSFTRLMEALRFKVSIETLPEFGPLPIVMVTSPITTMLPPDHVIIESTEISGTNAFEEVFVLESLRNLEDPLRNQLVDLVHGVSPALLE